VGGWENPGKSMGKASKVGKTMGKPWNKRGKTIRSWKTMGKLSENHVKTMGYEWYIDGVMISWRFSGILMG
jgi:hypothetical protein